MRAKLLRIVLPLALGIAVLCLWQALVTAYEIPRIVLPAPTQIAAAGMANFSSLMTASWMTLRITLAAFALALAGGVAEAVECRAVEPRARITLVDIDMIVFEFVAVGGRPAAEGLELAVNRLVTPLLVGRDSGVDRRFHGVLSGHEMRC